MTRESVGQKAARYLAEGRVVVTHVLGDQVAAISMGETGAYDLGHTPGRGWFCSCPVRAELRGPLRGGAVTAAGAGGSELDRGWRPRSP